MKQKAIWGFKSKKKPENLPASPPSPISEATLQKLMIDYLQIALPETSIVFHIPNGGKRDPKEAARFKKMGVKAGIPDLFIGYQGIALFVEVKAGKGRLSKNQNKMIRKLEEAGFPAVVIRNLKELKQALRLVDIPQKTLDFF